MKRTVLILSDQPPLPRNHGNWQRAHQTLRHFKEAGYEIYLLLYPTEKRWSYEIPAYYQELKEIVDFISIIRRGESRRRPPAAQHHEVDDWWDDTIAAELQWLLARKHFDVLFVNYIYFSKAFELAPISAVKILDIHDLFAGRAELFERHGVHPEGFYTYAEQERVAFDRADIVIAIKQSDCDVMRKSTRAEVICIPYASGNTLSVDTICDGVEFREERPLNVGFIGSENSVNVENLGKFVPLLGELLRNTNYPIVLTVAGNVCRRLGIMPSFVRLLGYLENLEDFYRNVDLIIIPFEFSTGIKIKAAEALAWRKPVIATSDAFDGFTSFHPTQALKSLQELCTALGHVASSALSLRLLQIAAERSAEAAKLSASAGFTKLEQSVAGRAVRLIVCTSRPFWRRATLYDEFASQWLERLHRFIPLVVLYNGSDEMSEDTFADQLELRDTVFERVEASKAGPANQVDTRVSFGKYAIDVCGKQVDLTSGRRFTLIAEEGALDAGPKIGAEANGVLWPLGPFRYQVGMRLWNRMRTDRSRVLVIELEPPCEWDMAASILLNRIVNLRGLLGYSISCPDNALRNELFFRDLIAHLPQPTVFIGRECVAWHFIRYLLNLGDIPYLQLSSESIVPLVRLPEGGPSLIGSIEGFLDGNAPLPARPMPDAGWADLMNTLAVAAVGS